MRAVLYEGFQQLPEVVTVDDPLAPMVAHLRSAQCGQDAWRLPSVLSGSPTDRTSADDGHTME
jgi:hypothetical protein